MSFTLVTGHTQQMSVALIDGFGATLRGIGVPLWSSSNPLIASVNAVGVVTGVADGVATISAAVGGIVGTSVVTVSSTLTIVSDTFTRGDSLTSLGTADTGQAWSALGGTWGIASNQARLVTDAGSNANAAVINAGVSDCTITVTYTHANQEQRLVWRATDASNFFICQGSGGSAQIFRRQAGSYSALTTTPVTPSYTPTDNDVVSVTVLGANITLKVNGVLLCTASDTFQQTATLHGLGANTDTTLRWDNFLVTVP